MFFLNMILVYKKINTQIRKCFFLRAINKWWGSKLMYLMLPFFVFLYKIIYEIYFLRGIIEKREGI